MLKEELKHIDTSYQAVKKTGITLGIILIIISLILWWADDRSFVYFSIAGGAFIIVTFIALPVLRPFHKFWMGLSLILGFVMSRIILTILFYLVLSPIGLVAKIVGKKFMPIKPDKNKSSYWEKRSAAAKQHIDYERQF